MRYLLKKGYLYPLFMLMISFLMSCSDASSEKEFQVNEASGFKLMEMLEGEGALKNAWDNIDGEQVSKMFADLVNDNIDDFKRFTASLGNLLTHNTKIIQTILSQDIRAILGRFLDSTEIFQRKEDIGSVYSQSDSDLTSVFFDFLDSYSDDSEASEQKSSLEAIRIVLTYYMDKYTESDLRDDAQELIDDIADNDFTKNFNDITELIAKATIQADYPMWIDSDGKPYNKDDIQPGTHTNLEMGNVVAGNIALASGVNQLTADPSTNQLMRNLLLESARLFDPNSTKNENTIRNAITEVEDNFTKGGAVYDDNKDSIYQRNDDEIYAEAELKANLLDLLPFLAQYFIRADRPNSMISDIRGIKQYPLDILLKNLNRIEWDAETAGLERSIGDLMRVDIFGRDRVTNPAASHASFLETTLAFLTSGSNTGFDNGYETGEYDAHPDGTTPSDSGPSNGHGKNIEGITVNDVLLSMTTKKALGLLSLHDLAFTNVSKDNLFRRYKPFTTTDENIADYRFNYDENYIVGKTIAGNPGDMGDPDGGINPTDGGEPILNAYNPYSPDGIKEFNVGVDTMSAAVTSTWHNDGPYYYADDNPPQVEFKGKTWSKYFTPNGEIYAYIHKPDASPTTWQYYYPAQYEGQGMDDYAYQFLKNELKKEYTVYTSNVDLVNSRRGRIEFTISMEGEELRIYERSTKYFSQGDIIEKINAASQNKLGKDICFPYNKGGHFIRIVAHNSPITIKNFHTLRSFEDPNSIKSFLDTRSEQVTTLIPAEITTPLNAFDIGASGSIDITIDGDSKPTVTFDDETIPEHNIWTIDSMAEEIADKIGSEYIEKFSNAFKIHGTLRDENASVNITTPDMLDDHILKRVFGIESKNIVQYFQRYNRMKRFYSSDHMMVRVKRLFSNKYQYIGIGRDSEGDLTTVKLEDGDQVPSFLVEHPYKQTEAFRECASYEEAMFRNYQYFLAEMKFIMILPFHLNLSVQTIIDGIKSKLDDQRLGFIFDLFRNININVDLGTAYQVVSTNGYTGFLHARKYLGNHVWAKKRSSGTSNIPGDYRLELVSAGSAKLVELILSDSMLYDDIIGNGTMFNGVLAHNSAALFRLAFPVAGKMNHSDNKYHSYQKDEEFNEDIEDYLISSREFEANDNDEIWKNRNALFPVIQALMGGLHRRTQMGYETHRGGILNIFEMAVNLMKPLFYYQKNDGEYPHNTWKPRLVDDHWYLMPSSSFHDFDNANMDTWYGNEEERSYYQTAKIKTLITTLIDQDPYAEGLFDTDNPHPGRNNGLLPMLMEHKVGTKLFKLMVHLGGDSFDDPVVADTAGFDDDMNNWGPRRKILYGLEQLVTAGKFTKGENTKISEGALSDDPYYRDNIGSYKNRKFPNYMFAEGVENSRDAYGFFTQYTNVRDDDYILDIGLEKIIGHDKVDTNDGFGLAAYPDEKLTEADWEPFYKKFEFLEAILSENSQYYIADVGLDYLFSNNKEYSIEEIKGLIYSFGKLFVYFDPDVGEYGEYIHEGSGEKAEDKNFNQIYTLIKTRLPVIHNILKDETGGTYYINLRLMEYMLRKGGLIDFIFTTVTVPDDWETIFNDIHGFFGKKIISEVDPLWTTLVEILDGFGNAISSTYSSANLSKFNNKYGFMEN